MESQFVSPYAGPLLGDIEFDFPEGTHAIGRLDKHSEGLLLPKPLPDHLTTSWLRITLTEGRFHQVRKMVAAVRHRCLRLLRVSIEDLVLGDLPPGNIREVDEDTFFTLLQLDERPSALLSDKYPAPAQQLPSMETGLHRA